MIRRLILNATLATSVLVIVLVVADAPQSARALVVFPYLLVVPGLPWALAFRLGTWTRTLVVAMSLSLGVATVLSYLSYELRTGRGLPTLLLLAVCAAGGVLFESRMGSRFAAASDATSLERKAV